MSNSYDRPVNDDNKYNDNNEQRAANYHLKSDSKSRVIEIPVKHITKPSSSSSTTNSPNNPNPNYFNTRPARNPTLNTNNSLFNDHQSNLFSDYQSPFGKNKNKF